MSTEDINNVGNVSPDHLPTDGPDTSQLDSGQVLSGTVDFSHDTPRHLAGIDGDVSLARLHYTQGNMLKSADVLDSIARDATALSNRIRNAEQQRRATEQP